MLAFFENLFRGPDLLILAVLGLLIFGRRLPEVGRGLGRSIVEFRKGLKDVKDEVERDEPPALPKAKPPVTSTGEDARVSRSPAAAEPSEPDPMP